MYALNAFYQTLQGILQDYKAYLLPAGFCIETNQVVEWYVFIFLEIYIS